MWSSAVTSAELINCKCFSAVNESVTLRTRGQSKHPSHKQTQSCSRLLAKPHMPSVSPLRYLLKQQLNILGNVLICYDAVRVICPFVSRCSYPKFIIPTVRDLLTPSPNNPNCCVHCLYINLEVPQFIN